MLLITFQLNSCLQSKNYHETRDFQILLGWNINSPYQSCYAITHKKGSQLREPFYCLLLVSTFLD